MMHHHGIGDPPQDERPSPDDLLDIFHDWLENIDDDEIRCIDSDFETNEPVSEGTVTPNPIDSS